MSSKPQQQPLKMRSNPLEVFCKKEVLENLTKFKGRHLGWSLPFKQSYKLESYILIKKRLQQRYFHENSTKFLRKPILENICERLLLEDVSFQEFHYFLVVVFIDLSQLTFQDTSQWMCFYLIQQFIIGFFQGNSLFPPVFLGPNQNLGMVCFPLSLYQCFVANLRKMPIFNSHTLMQCTTHGHNAHCIFN